MGRLTFAVAIAEEDRYHRQLDRLETRARGRRIVALEQDGVRFARLLDDRDRALGLMARAVGDGSYRPSPVTLATAQLGGKAREIGRAGALDLLVHAVIAEVIAEVLEPLLSARLYSYRRGRSPWQAVRALACVARKHCTSEPDPRKRGIYVLRSDVKSYTDSIPLAADAPLWSDLESALDLRAFSPHFEMLRALLQPEIQAADGACARRDRGLLFGLPTTNVLGNVYLAPLDAALEQLGGAYARFGDDLVFASDDPGRVDEARAVLDRVLGERGLTINEKKLRFFYWNGAPRASLERPAAIPTRTIAFLGAAIAFEGTIGMTAEKWRILLSDLRGRIKRTARLAARENVEARARLLSEVVTAAFDVRSPMPVALAPALAELVSDRRQLAQLDYLLARWVAEAATGITGPRAFRTLRPAWLRRRGGLISRVVARNRGRA